MFPVDVKSTPEMELAAVPTMLPSEERFPDKVRVLPARLRTAPP